MAYNPNFQWKRKTVTISVPTSDLPAGYQVKLVIPKETEMQADFRDLRFETTNGIGLPHWLESIVSNTATIWLRLKDSVTAGSLVTVDIYMYYGNPYVASVSNGTNTFIAFSDSSDIANWVADLGTTPTISVSSGDIRFQATAQGLAKKNITTISSDTVIAEYRFKEVDASGVDHPSFGFLGATTSDRASFDYESDVQTTWSMKGGTSYTSFAFNTYYIERNILNVTGKTVQAQLFSDVRTSLGSPPAAVAWEGSITTLTKFNAGTYYAANNADLRLTWMLIRKYVATEPTVPSAATIAGLTPTTVNWNPQRKKIIINTTTIPTNYQIKLTIPFAKEMNVDFSDLRFVTKTGISLSYWLESSTPGVEAIVLVKLIDALTTASDYIYMHYGNTNLTSASNVANTFVREISGVIGAWDLNEDALDRSGKGNNGTLNGGMGYAIGRTGQAGNFASSDITANDISEYNFNARDGSISAWIKADTMSSPGMTIIGQVNVTQDWIIYVYPTGSIGVGKCGINEIVSATGVITSGTWYHVVVSRVGSTTTVYVNNIQVASNTTAVWTDSAQPLRIGHHYYGGTHFYFDGLIEDIRIYNKALTSAEIADLFNNASLVSANYLGKELVRKYTATEPTIDYTTSPEQMNSFTRRKTVTINNNSGSSLTDYQVLITVAYDSDMQTNFNDIRFVDSNGNLLPYWIESKTDSSTANVWIKVNLPNYGTSPIGDNTVYMYYGNPDAASASDGTNTFDLFDDFNSNTLDTSKWNDIGGTNTFINGYYQLIGGGTAPMLDGLQSKVTFTDCIIESKFMYDVNYNACICFRGNGSNWENMYFFMAQTPWQLDKKVSGSYFPLSGTNQPPAYTLGTWVNIKILCIGTLIKVWVDSTLSVDITDSTFTGAGSVGTSIWGVSSNYARYDDFKVRKAVTTEPTVTTGSEESPIGITADSMTITKSENPCRTGFCTVTVDVIWKNNSLVPESFIPSIKINNVTAVITPALPSVTVNPSGTKAQQFILPSLLANTYAICPDPN